MSQITTAVTVTHALINAEAFVDYAESMDLAGLDDGFLEAATVAIENMTTAFARLTPLIEAARMECPNWI